MRKAILAISLLLLALFFSGLKSTVQAQEEGFSSINVCSEDASPSCSLQAQCAEKKPPKPVPTIAYLFFKAAGGLKQEVLQSLIDVHRAALGLAAFQKDDKLCQLAKDRAPELANEVATGTMHKGLYDRKLPYWITEDMIYMNSEQAAFNWWMHSPIHRHAIEGNYKYSCGACYGYACSQLFTNYEPK